MAIFRQHHPSSTKIIHRHILDQYFCVRQYTSPTFQAHIGGFYVWQGVFLPILTLLAVLVGRLVDLFLFGNFTTPQNKIKLNELIAHMRQPLIAVSIGATLFWNT